MTLPTPLHLHPRRFFAGLVTACAVVLGPVCIYGVVAFATMVAGRRGPAVPALLGLAALVAWGLVLRANLKALRWQGPALVLDANGVTDLWRKRPTVPWSAIADARVVDNEGDELLLRLREGATGQPTKIFIDLTRLQHDRKTVERTVFAHLSHANQIRMPMGGA